MPPRQIKKWCYDAWFYREQELVVRDHGPPKRRFECGVSQEFEQQSLNCMSRFSRQPEVDHSDVNSREFSRRVTNQMLTWGIILAVRPVRRQLRGIILLCDHSHLWS
jgi:hypothetical protein